MSSPSVESYEGPGTIAVNGRVLADATKISVEIDTRDNEVNTMRKGMAGFSDGSTVTKITIDSAVPRKGMEADFLMYVTKRKPVSITTKVAGKRITAGGRFMKYTLNQSTDSPASVSTDFSGGEPQVVG